MIPTAASDMDIDDLLDLLIQSEKDLPQLSGLAYDIKKDEIVLIQKIIVAKRSDFRPGTTPP